MRRPDALPELEFKYFAVNLPAKLKMVKIAPTSDVHYGNPSCSLKHLDKHIEYIASDPELYTFLNGDLIECVTRASKGEIYKQVGSPGDQRDFIIKKFEPIKHKILGCTQGNHEARITEFDASADIAQALGVPYRAEGMLLKISFGSGNERHIDKPYVYWGYFTHGYGGARTNGAKAVKVERASTFFEGVDFLVMSHDHTVNVAPRIALSADNRTHLDKETGFNVGRMSARRIMLVKSSAFLKWQGYSEIGGFAPSDLTTPLIKLDGGGQKRIRVEV